MVITMDNEHFHVDGVKPGKILIHIEGIVVVVKDLLLCLENLLSFLKNGILWSSSGRRSPALESIAVNCAQCREARYDRRSRSLDRRPRRRKTALVRERTSLKCRLLVYIGIRRAVRWILSASYTISTSAASLFPRQTCTRFHLSPLSSFIREEAGHEPRSPRVLLNRPLDALHPIASPSDKSSLGLAPSLLKFFQSKEIIEIVS